MAATHEHGFTLVTDEELQVGFDYAAKKDGITLRLERLRTLTNNAGKTRLNAGEKLTPREIAARAVRAYLRSFRGIAFTEREFQGYVHAIAKILSERNPNTKAKRLREKAAAELAAVSYGIQRTPDMDPRTQYEIEHGFTGHPLE